MVATPEGFVFCFLCRDRDRHLGHEYRITGSITSQDGKTVRVSRTIRSSPRFVRDDVLRALERRADRGAPWYGDAVTVTGPSGSSFTVDVPWPTYNP